MDEQQLLDSVRKAQKQARRQQDARLDTLHAGYWKDSMLYLVELFWMDVLSGTVSTEDLDAELKYRKIPHSVVENSYFLVLLQCHPQRGEGPVIDRNLYEFTLKNIAREFFYEQGEFAVVVRVSGQDYVMMIPVKRRTGSSVAERCREALREFCPHFPNAFTFYVALQPAGIGGIAEVYDGLQGLAGENISRENQVSEVTEQMLAHYRADVAEEGEQSVVVTKVQTYIRTHLEEEMSRETLAAMVYLSPDYLSHIFKQMTGCSVTGYIINERINEAKRLLTGTDLSIRDIAVSCGFQSISYFSRQFRRVTGMTPREFRRQKF